MKKETFYLLAAAIGAYAAWLQIKKHHAEQQASDWLTAGAFSTPGQYDFYGNAQSYDWLADANPNEWYGL